MFAMRWRSTWFVGVLLCSLAACNPSQPEAVVEPAEVASPKVMAAVSAASVAALAQYESQAREFLKQLEAGADAQALQPLVQSMLDLSLEVVPDYVAAVPACKSYLLAAAQIGELWPELEPERIERDYHQDGALPPMPTNVDCYHMKDVVVHPATALALLAQPELDREQLRLEIFEVVSHAIAVRTGSGFNADDGD